jgi:hypothetical protein
MATQVSICNLALGKFGGVTITDINENTRESRACKSFWDHVRDKLIKDYPWRFALKRFEIGAALSEAPAFPEEHYYYPLPTDCLRVFELWESGQMSDAQWSIEGNKLLTAIEDPQIRYIARITDVSQYGPEFVECFACALAAEIGPKLTDNPKLRVDFLNELSINISKAEKLNAIEGNPPKHKDEQGLDAGNFSWQTTGR